VRIASHVKGSAELPLLEDQPELRNLLLGIYAFEHLRGEAPSISKKNLYTCKPP
jgi:hypothetical protein